MWRGVVAVVWVGEVRGVEAILLNGSSRSRCGIRDAGVSLEIKHSFEEGMCDY